MSLNNSSFFPLMYNDDDSLTRELIPLFTFLIVSTIALFGVVSNIFNTIVYYRLKGGDPININLLGLAVSDFLVCLTTLALVCLTGYWYIDELSTALKINTFEVFYIFIGVPHTIFIRISILLTALISLERCLCVVMPLKVKMLVSRGRVKVSVVLCFLVGILVAIPIYAINGVEWVYQPGLNVSILRYVKTDNFYEVNSWFTPIEGVCLHVIPFLTVAVSTVVMVRHLKEQMAFRSAMTKTRSNEMVYKEKKVAKMVFFISVLFLICNLPNIVTFLIVAFFPSFFIFDKSQDHLVQLVGYIHILLGTFNASMTFVIYFKNSSNYRGMLKKIFYSRNTARQ